MPDRLFLFAGFDKDCIIDDALIYYVKTLSKYGDVIVCMDSACPKKETDKIKKYTVHTIAVRHGEYDFGSYKRAYQYARDKKILKNYDYLYLVNDSVFGPTINIKQILNKIESKNDDAVGMVVSKHKTHSFMESWFVRLNRKIFLSSWFDEFMSSVCAEPDKSAITIKYEHGLTNLIQKHNCTWGGIFTVHGRGTYNKPKKLFQSGMPFIKKMSFTRHNGALGNQIKYILNNCDGAAKNAILKSAHRLYGTEYMNWFLTTNPIKIFMRNITYITKKIRK